jgi:hypothetical protein
MSLAEIVIFTIFTAVRTDARVITFVICHNDSNIKRTVM